MATLTDFVSISVKLDFQMIGATPAGMRIDVPFTGVATSSHWEGERPVTGVDYVTIGAGGVQSPDIRGQIGSGKEVIAYRAIGRGAEAGPKELFIFETANEELAWVNNAVGVAIGSLEGNKLSLDVQIID